MINVQEYTKHLFDALEMKKDLSIYEFGRSDINNKDNPNSVELWYRQLKSKIASVPPTDYVKGINIFVKGDAIVDIEYNYCKKETDLNDVSFQIYLIGVDI